MPRLAFVNKLDRAGADPWRVRTSAHVILPPTAMTQGLFLLHECMTCSGTPCGLNIWFTGLWLVGILQMGASENSLILLQVIGQMQDKLRLHCSPVQIPLGLEDKHTGLVDLVKMKAFHFRGPNGEDIMEVSVLRLAHVMLQNWPVSAS